MIFCAFCKKEFPRSKGHINEGFRFGYKCYCSKVCQYKSQVKERFEVICLNSLCGRKSLRTAARKSPFSFCSKSCAAKVNNHKFPKRTKSIKTCGRDDCGMLFAGESKFCSNTCRSLARQSFSRDFVINKVKEYAEALGRPPSKRELRHFEPAAKFYFGSWNNAILAAGLEPNRSCDNRMYKRIQTFAKDGHQCDSVSEAIIDNWLTKANIPHERDYIYPKTRHRADWAVRVRRKLFFIEYFGLAHDSPRYDRSISKKRRLCREGGVNLIEIFAPDLYPRVRLGDKLGCLLNS